MFQPLQLLLLSIVVGGIYCGDSLHQQETESGHFAAFTCGQSPRPALAYDIQYPNGLPVTRRGKYQDSSNYSSYKVKDGNSTNSGYTLYTPKKPGIGFLSFNCVVITEEEIRKKPFTVYRAKGVELLEVSENKTIYTHHGRHYLVLSWAEDGILQIRVGLIQKAGEEVETTTVDSSTEGNNVEFENNLKELTYGDGVRVGFGIGVASTLVVVVVVLAVVLAVLVKKQLISFSFGSGSGSGERSKDRSMPSGAGADPVTDMAVGEENEKEEQPDEHRVDDGIGEDMPSMLSVHSTLLSGPESGLESLRDDSKSARKKDMSTAVPVDEVELKLINLSDANDKPVDMVDGETEDCQEATLPMEAASGLSARSLNISGMICDNEEKEPLILEGKCQPEYNINQQGAMFSSTRFNTTL